MLSLFSGRISTGHEKGELVYVEIFNGQIPDGPIPGPSHRYCLATLHIGELSIDVMNQDDKVWFVEGRSVSKGGNE